MLGHFWAALRLSSLGQHWSPLRAAHLHTKASAHSCFKPPLDLWLGDAFLGWSVFMALPSVGTHMCMCTHMYMKMPYQLSSSVHSPLTEILWCATLT